MKKATRNIVTIGAAILVTAAMAGILIHNKQISEARVYRPDPNRAVLVGTDTVRIQKMNIARQYVGAFEPVRQVTIAAQTQGKIVTMGVEEGERIRSGALVAQVDEAYEQARLLAAEAHYRNIRRKLQRYQDASTGEGVSQMQVDNVRTEMQEAKAQVEQLKVQIERAHITAPFSGTITRRYVDPGATVAFDSPIAELLDLSALELVVTVPEEEIGNFEEGQSINVFASLYPDTAFAGTVTVVSASADASHKFEVKIRVDNSHRRLRAGMFGKISPVRTRDSVLAIPRTTLMGTTQDPQVFAVRDSVARLQDIEIGESNDRLIGVSSGLQEGDVIVTRGQINITDGTKVQGS